MTLDEFMKNYASGDAASRVVLDMEVQPFTEDSLSPFIVLRFRGRVMVLDAMALSGKDGENEHLCLDVHSFIDGQEARAGVFGMEQGARVQFPAAKTPGRSHNWPATKLVAILLGRQTNTPKEKNA